MKNKASISHLKLNLIKNWKNISRQRAISVLNYYGIKNLNNFYRYEGVKDYYSGSVIFDYIGVID